MMPLEIWKKIIRKNYDDKLRAKLRYDNLRQLKNHCSNTGYTNQQLQDLSELFYQRYTYDKNGTPYSNDDLSDLIEEGTSHRERVIISDRFFALKFPSEEDEGYDAVFQETAIGLQVNNIRNMCPNFVYTFGLCKTEPPRSIRKEYRRQNYHCSVVEHIRGRSFTRVSSDRSFEENYDIYLQIWLALAFAQCQMNLTHYDLHTGNVIIVDLPETILIDYPWGTVKTRSLVKIIDWGRSFAQGEYKGKKVNIGKIYPRLGIQMAPNYFYDCYLILRRSVGRSSSHAVSQFLNFFDVKYSSSDHRDLIDLSKKSYDWFEWLDLISQHAYARNCFKARTETLPDPLNYPHFELPKQYTFRDVEKYLSDWRAQDYSTAREQRDIENSRLVKIREMRQKLYTQTELPVKLEKVDLNDFTNEAQEKILSSLNNIVNENPTRHLGEHLDYYIETVLQRLDFLNRLINLQTRS